MMESLMKELVKPRIQKPKVMGRAMGGMDMASRKNPPPIINEQGNTLSLMNRPSPRKQRKLAI